MSDDVQLDIFGAEIPVDDIAWPNCTGTETCAAEADEHHPDCPVEKRLLAEIGF
jgi:hypothetical protein